ncbi:MAG TPA: methylmalonyl Co-A mutase-associated GTPase MeaB, partial [Planctomycetia bacterium]|nr:methylmalonyl Co-A mutase-associated GTPase MeaB [Planctomycetia bacterium]
PARRAPVIGLTGPAGVGKSSLLGALVSHLLAQGRRIGVLACDPESPLTGGALLGDRCRIVGPDAAPNLFLRSLAAASGGQALAPYLDLQLELMRRFPFDLIFLETVGAGQGDVAIRRLVDLLALVLQPQTGDSLQWEKAGLLELANLVILNKCDLPGADHVAADLRESLAVPLHSVSVLRGEGIAELADAMAGPLK